ILQRGIALTNSLCGLKTKAPYKHAQPSIQRLCIVRQQVIAPLDGIPQRLMLRRNVSPAFQEIETLIEAVQHYFVGKNVGTRRGEFNGEWQSVQPDTDLRYSL